MAVKLKDKKQRMPAESKATTMQRAEAAISEMSQALEQLRRESASAIPFDPAEQQKLEIISGKLASLRELVAARRGQMSEKRVQRRAVMQQTRERIAALRARIEQRKVSTGAAS